MKITAKQLHDKLEANHSILLLDVRSPAEYRESHIAGSVLAPLHDLNIDEIMTLASEHEKCVVCCLSGKRAEKAEALMVKRGCKNVEVLDGGIGAWRNAGLPVITGKSCGLSIMRQVHTVVALGVTIGLVLAFTVNLWFLAIPVFFGLGLTFASITGKCGMAYLLAKMPWNRCLNRP